MNGGSIQNNPFQEKAIHRFFEEESPNLKMHTFRFRLLNKIADLIWSVHVPSEGGQVYHIKRSVFENWCNKKGVGEGLHEMKSEKLNEIAINRIVEAMISPWEKNIRDMSRVDSAVSSNEVQEKLQKPGNYVIEIGDDQMPAAFHLKVPVNRKDFVTLKLNVQIDDQSQKISLQLDQSNPPPFLYKDSLLDTLESEWFNTAFNSMLESKTLTSKDILQYVFDTLFDAILTAENTERGKKKSKIQEMIHLKCAAREASEVEQKLQENNYVVEVENDKPVALYLQYEGYDSPLKLTIVVDNDDNLHFKLEKPTSEGSSPYRDVVDKKKVLEESVEDLAIPTEINADEILKTIYESVKSYFTEPESIPSQVEERSISNEERERIMNDLSCDEGEEASIIEIRRNTLLRNSLEPQTHVTVGENSVYFSQPFVGRALSPLDEEPRGEWYCIGYVETIDKDQRKRYLPRLFYRSNPQGIWRVVPYLEQDGSRSEGIPGRKSSVNLPRDIQNHLNLIAFRNPPDEILDLSKKENGIQQLQNTLLSTVPSVWELSMSKTVKDKFKDGHSVIGKENSPLIASKTLQVMGRPHPYPDPRTIHFRNSDDGFDLQSIKETNFVGSLSEDITVFEIPSKDKNFLYTLHLTHPQTTSGQQSEAEYLFLAQVEYVGKGQSLSPWGTHVVQVNPLTADLPMMEMDNALPLELHEVVDVDLNGECLTGVIVKNIPILRDLYDQLQIEYPA